MHLTLPWLIKENSQKKKNNNNNNSQRLLVVFRFLLSPRLSFVYSWFHRKWFQETLGGLDLTSLTLMTMIRVKTFFSKENITICKVNTNYFSFLPSISYLLTMCYNKANINITDKMYNSTLYTGIRIQTIWVNIGHTPLSTCMLSLTDWKLPCTGPWLEKWSLTYRKNKNKKLQYL